MVSTSPMAPNAPDPTPAASPSLAMAALRGLSPPRPAPIPPTFGMRCAPSGHPLMVSTSPTAPYAPKPMPAAPYFQAGEPIPATMAPAGENLPTGAAALATGFGTFGMDARASQGSPTSPLTPPPPSPPTPPGIPCSRSLPTALPLVRDLADWRITLRPRPAKPQSRRPPPEPPPGPQSSMPGCHT